MAKFSGPSVIPGAQVDLPTGQPAGGGDFAEFFAQPTEAPQAAPPVEGELPTAPAPEAAPAAPQAPHQIPGEVVEGVDLQEAADVQEQRARERVPALSEKVGGTFTDFVDSKEPIGAAVQRGNNVNNILEYSTTGTSLLAQPTTAAREQLQAGFPSAAFAREETATAPSALKNESAQLTAAALIHDPRLLNAGGAPNAEGHLTVDPEFGQILNYGVEKWLYQQSQAAGAPQQAETDAESGAEPTATRDFTRATGNQQLGREIFQEWRRQKAAREGQPTDSYVQDYEAVAPETFTFLGDMAKEVYAEANPDMLIRVPADQSADGQAGFALTQRGADAFDELNNRTGGLLAPAEVPPLNNPSATAQPVFEASTRVREKTTVVGELGNWGQVQEAMANYHSVGHVNDPAREAMAFQAAIHGMINAGQNNFYSNIFDVGLARKIEVENNLKKMQSDAERQQNPKKRAALERKIRTYDPKAEIRKDQTRFLKNMSALANYSGKKNHLTFSMQALTGRTHVQQTHYNPQSHKVTRFVSGSGNVFTWKPGDGALDRDWREIMATHFVQDERGVKGKDLNTTARLKHFDRMYRSGMLDKYIAMGKEIHDNTQAFDVNKAKELFLAIDGAQNPQEVRALTDQIKALAPTPLSTNTVNYIGRNDQGKYDTSDETLYEMEALVDLYKYDNAIKTGGQMSSTINVEMDGKTHGPATNGAQLGNIDMAKRTGLIRTLDADLTDMIDSRKAMGEWMLDTVETRELPEGQREAYVQILQAAVKDRANFLKKSPMTMGYGQELGSLRMHVDTTIFTGPEADTIRSIADSAGISHTEVGNFLHSMLVDSIYQIFDRSIVDSARLLHANNLIATITNYPLSFKNAMGFRSYAAAKQSKGAKDAQQAKFRFTKDGKSQPHTTYFYNEEVSGAADRTFDADNVATPGGYGHGRIVPISVQSYDGNMISKTGSGQSWDRVKKMSQSRGGKNAYVLPIFDAFKTDLGSFSAVRDESNRNWVNSLQDHSYVTSIMDTKDGWFGEALAHFQEKMKAYPDNQPIALNLDPDNEFRGMYWLFNVDIDKGDGETELALNYLVKKVKHSDPKTPEQSVQDYQKAEGRAAKKITKRIHDKMADAGIPERFDHLTKPQLLTLIKIVVGELNIRGRNDQMVREVTAKKAKLFDEVRRNSKEARQIDIA